MTVALIIPVWNEEEVIRRVLTEIPPGSVDRVIVVDGGGRGPHGGGRARGRRRRCSPQQRPRLRRRLRSPAQRRRGRCRSSSSSSTATTATPPACHPRPCSPRSQSGRGRPRARLARARAGWRPARSLGTQRRDRQSGWPRRLIAAPLPLARLTDLPSFKAIRREALAGFAMQEFTYGWTTEMSSSRRCAATAASSRWACRIGRAAAAGRRFRTITGTLLAGYRLIATTLRYARWTPDPVTIGPGRPPHS